MSLSNIVEKITGRKNDEFEGGGIVLFETTHDAMKAEKQLRHGGLSIKLAAPPVNMRIGCDLALEFNLIERVLIERILVDLKLKFIEIAKLEEGNPRPVSMVDTTDYGEFIMVRAGNMKITVRRSTGEIVNVSGGGCPDVPYLYRMLVGRNIEDAPSPSGLGYTLCALMLNRAFDECLSITGGN